MMIDKLHFIRRTLQLVVLVPLLSLFICYSSGSFNVYFSTFLFSFFAHTIERKYMFLLCNGILAFLAKTCSSRLSSPSSSDSNEVKTLVRMESDIRAIDMFAFTAEQEQEGQEEKEDEEDEEAEEQEGGQEEHQNESMPEEDDDDTKDEEKEEVIDEVVEVLQEEEEEDDDDEIAMAATITKTNGDLTSTGDEMNKKFEEFIRKMKEEIRIEAQQQLIAV